MEGNSIKSFENLCKIFEMRIKLDKERNIKTPSDVIDNYEKYAKKIDSIYNKEFEKEIRNLISPEVTLEKEETRLKRLIKLLEERLDKRRELEEHFYNSTGKYIDGFQLVVSEDELEEKKTRLDTITKYLTTKSEIDELTTSISKLKNSLIELEKEKEEYTEKNKVMEDNIYSSLMTSIKNDEYFTKINEDNYNIELSTVEDKVRENEETLEVTLDSVKSLMNSGTDDDYTSYIEDAEKNYYIWKNREIILKIYELVIAYEEDFDRIIAKRNKLEDLIEENNHLKNKLHIEDNNELLDFENLLLEQKDTLNSEKEVLENIVNYTSRIKFKEERLEELEEIKVDTTRMIPKEQVVVVVTNEGYIKKVPQRSYNTAKEEETTLKENDYVTGLYNITTTDTLLLFTNLGNYLYLPVYDIPEVKWKELGKHISNIISLSPEEKVINSIPVYNFDEERYITSFTKNGMIKRTLLNEFKVQRYSKPIKMMNLKGTDEVISVTDSTLSNVFIATSNGYGLWYDINEVPVVGIKAAGVKAISLKDDYVVSGILFDVACEYLTILTDKGTAKRMRLTELEKTSRAKRGILLMKTIKSNPSKIIKAYIINSKNQIGIVSDDYSKIVKLTEISIMDRYSNGSYIIKDRIIDSYIVSELISKEDKEEVTEEIVVEKKQISLSEIDDKLSNIDSIIKDINE